MHSSPVLPAPRDPLAKFDHPAVVSGTQRPVPLIATAFSVAIHGGLALVRTARTFRNAEAKPIEATISVPMPVRATLLSIIAEVDGRRLTGQAKRKQKAREAYEDGLERGKAVILHEEVLRGVHMISVGNIKPGAEIVVSDTWAMPLSAAPGNRATLRIPVAVGDVYGRSPLPESDDLMHGGARQEADLQVTSDAGLARVRGVPLDEEDHARILLDAPIDIEVADWQPGLLRGTAADSREVALEIVPAPQDEQPLDAAMLVDRSGSMDAVADGSVSGTHPHSKLAAVREGLAAAARILWASDRLDLWEFNGDCNPVPGASFVDAVARMQEARGGTETGAAVRTVLEGRKTRDVLILTDGKSHALDVQEAARSGRRFHAVLIGEDSLEAHIGHLAALTGGQVFIASGSDVGEAIIQALQVMRAPGRPAQPIDSAPLAAEAVAGGMRLRATWGPEANKDGRSTELARAVAAVAASLAIPSMDENAAAALAEAEGIVCHLTSLVLVDEVGEAVDGIAAHRKVATMTPRTAMPLLACADDRDAATVPHMVWSRRAPGSLRSPARMAKMRLAMDTPSAPPVPPPPPLRSFVGQADWSADPDAVSRGDLSSLPVHVVQAIRRAAIVPEVVALAAALGKNALAVAAALLAQSERWTYRSAVRLAKAVLKGADGSMLDAAKKAAGI